MARDEEVVPPAPAGGQNLRWLGPSIIWMISAIATGELLFTPRIASLYGYAVLWTMILAILSKALLAREIGRYAVVTGGSLLQGIRRFPGPGNWGIWVIVVPQLFVAAFTITGMAGAASSALILAVPGDFRFWGVVFLAMSVVLVFFGRYTAVERVSVTMSLAITAALIITASVVFPGAAPLIEGLVPSLPADVDFSELLPWLGFMMSGAAGLIWYSYWLAAKGYGSAYHLRSEEAEPIDPSKFSGEEIRRLKGWIRLMTFSTLMAASIILVLLIALMILGGELLRPQGLLPEGPAVTKVLSLLLGDVWGPPGRWLLILAAFFAFWSTIVACLDGWGRMLSQGSIFIANELRIRRRPASMGLYRNLYLFGLMGVIPIGLIIVKPEPVTFLKMAGIVEAVQIPIVAFSTIYLNRKLPPPLRPSLTIIVLLAGVGSFFLFFAAYYLHTELTPK